MDNPEIEPRTGKPKHFEQVAFERWLDANPNGTTLLLDTIDVHMGAVHAAMAATSNETRRRAFKGFRVDSGNLAELGDWCMRFFAANGLPGLRANLTGDLTVDRVKEIVKEFPEVGGFGIGTKLSSEVKAVAGVIFKQCVMRDRPTLKASNSEEKITLPGRLQLFRGSDARGMYVGDVIGLDSEEVEIPEATSVEKQKVFVEEQRRRFGDIETYPRQLSTRLRELRDDLVKRMRADHSGWEQILNTD
jgi:nicotinate phosphoribosyltransferase